MLLIVIDVSYTANSSQWKSKTIYQILTDRFAQTTDTTEGCNDLNIYCGGRFKGIINHYDSYINKLGFDAIWISPVVTNVPWSWHSMTGYHGYWAYNKYTINSHFGTENDLINLANLLHSNKYNAYLMIDVVANHMGPPLNGNYNNMTGYIPFNYL